jgi:hypothetical protein
MVTPRVVMTPGMHVTVVNSYSACMGSAQLTHGKCCFRAKKSAVIGRIHGWLDSERLDQDTEQSLPMPSSYAGVAFLGLRSISTPSTPSAAKSPGPIKSTIKSPLSLLPTLPPLIPLVGPSSPSPLVRCSLRLGDKAELTGGRKVYSRDDRRLKPLPPL